MLEELAFDSERERRSFAKMRKKTMREVALALNDERPPLACLGPIWSSVNYYRVYSSWLVFCGIVGGKFGYFRGGIVLIVLFVSAPFSG